MKIEIRNDKWNADSELKYIKDKESNVLTFSNTSDSQKEVKYTEKIVIKDKSIKQLKINFSGEYTNAGGYLVINEDSTFPFNSTSVFDITSPTYIEIKIVVAAKSSITFKDVDLETITDRIELVDKVSEKPNVLIITPDYPSLKNLYYCAFVHSRVKEYVNKGIKVQVASISQYNNYQITYDFEGIPVFKGNYQDLKNLLSKHQYKVIVTHFVDENLYPIFDGYINNEKLIFICHGPETVFRYLVNVTRPYFTKELQYPIQDEVLNIKESYVKKYSQKDNVEWVFVSDWLKNFSEEQLGIKFKNVRVINNVINEKLFPYSPKKAEDRCKILVIRKFDNIIQHSIDQVVLSILELSRRPFFDKLTFEIYGDGNFYDELIEPIRDFENVHLHRTFIPNNQIHLVHKEAGILLIPSRHDAHAVAMGEGASSGLVVVGSRVTSNPFFMNEKENHTLADPEDYVELADIIERMYNNPKEFLEISERLSKETRENYCKKNTVEKEIDLINEKMSLYNEKIIDVKPSKEPILTIAIPAYNVEKYIEKCLNSILKATNIQDIEILVINDGSKDKTAQITARYEKNTNGIVKLINKENGGHGSTINTAIEKAKGKYFRLVDGDDWVDAENLAKLVEILKQCNSDIVLTKGSYEYTNVAPLRNIIEYDNLIEGNVYHFDDLVYKGYGFNTYGPLLTTGNYKTEILRKANFKISEKRPYVDMEFNSFSLKYADTLEYYDLDIYRYLIGREGQTVSREYWKKKYKDHIYIIFNILETVKNSKEFSKNKIRYIYNNIIAQMVDSQIFMFDTLCLWKEIEPFLEKLKEYQEAYEISINYIVKKDGNCRLILEKYKDAIKSKRNKQPIIIPQVRETIYDLNQHPLNRMNLKWLIKSITPYGIIQLFRRKKDDIKLIVKSIIPYKLLLEYRKRRGN